MRNQGRPPESDAIRKQEGKEDQPRKTGMTGAGTTRQIIARLKPASKHAIENAKRKLTPERTEAMHGERVTADMACSARFTAVGACARERERERERERGRAVRALLALHHVPNLARAIPWTSSLRDVIGREIATARWVGRDCSACLRGTGFSYLLFSDPMSECASAIQSKKVNILTKQLRPMADSFFPSR